MHGFKCSNRPLKLPLQIYYTYFIHIICVLLIFDRTNKYVTSPINFTQQVGGTRVAYRSSDSWVATFVQNIAQYFVNISSVHTYKHVINQLPSVQDLEVVRKNILLIFLKENSYECPQFLLCDLAQICTSNKERNYPNCYSINNFNQNQFKIKFLLKITHIYFVAHLFC